jgi:hypothetical protein
VTLKTIWFSKETGTYVEMTIRYCTLRFYGFQLQQLVFEVDVNIAELSGAALTRPIGTNFYRAWLTRLN